MSYQIDEIDLSPKLAELSLELPAAVAFFPENLDSAQSKTEFIFSDSLIDLNKVLRKNNITIPPFGNNAELTRSRKNADIYIPAIFFSASVLSDNPNLVSLSHSISFPIISLIFLKGGWVQKKLMWNFI